MTSKRTRILLVAGATVLVLLCIVAAATYYMVGWAPQCALPQGGPAEPGWSARIIESGGLERCYFLYVPPGYDPARAEPLVTSFHGFLSNPNSHALITGWDDLADREGFLVAYPQGREFPQRWNAGQTWGASAVDDVQFFLDLLADVSSIAAVDPSRVYVNGFSNGGGMTVRIGCEAAGKVAAAGSVAGAVVDLDECSPSRPLPIMAFHGSADPIVNYDGLGMQYRLLRSGAGMVHAPVHFVGAEEWTADWAALNGCDPVPQAIPPRGDVSGVRYALCDQDASVVFYTIEGGGHTWPGGWPIPAVGKTSKDIDATEELWRFFQAYRLEGLP